jgi:hypothetical protein
VINGDLKHISCIADIDCWGHHRVAVPFQLSDAGTMTKIPQNQHFKNARSNSVKAKVDTGGERKAGLEPK